MTTSRFATGACLLLAVSGCGGDYHDTAAPAAAKAVRLGGVVRQGAAPAAVTFAGNLSQYTVSGSNLSVTDNLSGTVRQIAATDRLQFADTALSLDLAGIPGQAYRIYQAAFNRAPDIGGLSFWINVLDGGGADLTAVAQSFINSAEFTNTYGNVSNVDYVVLLYRNVLHRDPDQGGQAFWVGLLDGSNAQHTVATRAQVLASFSESAENQANVLAAIKNGVLYYPTGFTAPANPVSDFAGNYSGSFSGSDSGTFTLTTAQSGALTVAMHLNAANLDLSGTGTVAAGGKFTASLSGPNVSGNLNGSINLGSRLATGVWGISNGGGNFNATKPAPPPAGPTFSAIQTIVQQRCVPCHSAQPTIAGFNPAPLGIMFDTEAQIRGSVSDINTYAVRSKIMPYANMTRMTDAERATIAAWIAAGTP